MVKYYIYVTSRLKKRGLKKDVVNSCVLDGKYFDHYRPAKQYLIKYFKDNNIRFNRDNVFSRAFNVYSSNREDTYYIWKEPF